MPRRRQKFLLLYFFFLFFRLVVSLLQQRGRELGQKFIGLLFFSQRLRQQLGDLGLSYLLCNRAERAITRDLVMLHFLRGCNQTQIRFDFVLLLAFRDHFLPFFHQALHSLTGL